ncbi:sorting nexin-29 [Wyeomyia smithii]|uniref:sorting nexin-29 n=1 Tax=Wyeomyia smithii TaxID=174621 RepID=UPI002467F506|nr:sorting nexin-29 [Wyeomyia smithii]XP_055534926.1 sorting nexin-29 [Wyeomyia smithii]
MVGMSNFTLDPAILGAGSSGAGRKHELERKALADELLTVVKECQKKYGSKTELATESDSRIVLLCDTWERALSHGLKSSASLLKNVADLVAGGNLEAPNFWDFAFKHLTNHEKERFSTLRHVWTNGGKGKALLRAILNERALERYILIWLSDEQLLQENYEVWALIRDKEITGLLPDMAAGLSTILFAIAIDAPELNAVIKIKPEKSEPIIATQRPANPARKINIVQREILEEGKTSSPVLNLSTALIQPAQRRTANIDIIREYTHVEPNQRTQEAYSVEDALNNLAISQEIRRQSTPAERVNLASKFANSGASVIATSPDCTALEASEDSILGNFSLDMSNATTTASNTSSTSCSASSANDQALDVESYLVVVDKLKKKLADSEERCQMLEARVAELSLENHRLRMLTRPNRLSLMHFQISIPKAILRTPVSARRREHYCYEIRIAPGGGDGGSTMGSVSSTDTVSNEGWSVFRRYSDFYRLHKRLQREHPSVKSLDFPPKKKIGNMNPQFVEQRRQRLQVYLNSLFIVVMPEVSACTTRSQLEQVFPFLRDAVL